MNSDEAFDGYSKTYTIVLAELFDENPKLYNRCFMEGMNLFLDHAVGMCIQKHSHLTKREL